MPSIKDERDAVGVGIYGDADAPARLEVGSDSGTEVGGERRAVCESCNGVGTVGSGVLCW